MVLEMADAVWQRSRVLGRARCGTAMGGEEGDAKGHSLRDDSWALETSRHAYRRGDSPGDGGCPSRHVPGCLGTRFAAAMGFDGESSAEATRRLHWPVSQRSRERLWAWLPERQDGREDACEGSVNCTGTQDICDKRQNRRLHKDQSTRSRAAANQWSGCVAGVSSLV
jgi:hypothetical protein